MATLVNFRLIASSTTIAAWMPSWAAKRKMGRSWALFTHWVIDAEPAAGVMILVMPFSCRWRSPAMTTPVFTDPITPDRSGIAASSCAMSAPRSFLASSSRSMTSIFSLLLPTWMPPPALISATASLAPSRIDAPMGAEPPLNGPVIASLMVFAARAGRARASISKDGSNLVIGLDLRGPGGGRGRYHGPRFLLHWRPRRVSLGLWHASLPGARMPRRGQQSLPGKGARRADDLSRRMSLRRRALSRRCRSLEAGLAVQLLHLLAHRRAALVRAGQRIHARERRGLLDGLSVRQEEHPPLVLQGLRRPVIRARPRAERTDGCDQHALPRGPRRDDVAGAALRRKEPVGDMKRIWAGRVVSVVVTLPFAMSAVMKLMRHPEVIKGMSHLGMPESLIIPLGVIELLCVVVYLVPKTSILGAILLTGYVGGTIITHLRVGEPVYMQIALGILTWIGLYLRRPRLREVIWAT